MYRVTVVILLGFAAFQALAQSTTAGTVSGQVTDQQSGLIVGAEVRLSDVQTNTARTAVTNEAGRYSFINVPPGIYDITVSKQGFSQARLAAQTVQVGLTLTANMALQIGSTTTTVEVVAGAGACCCCCCCLSCASWRCFSICGIPMKYCHPSSTIAESTMAMMVFLSFMMCFQPRPAAFSAGA